MLTGITSGIFYKTFSGGGIGFGFCSVDAGATIKVLEG
jgi:hypothetical protein